MLRKKIKQSCFGIMDVGALEATGHYMQRFLRLFAATVWWEPMGSPHPLSSTFNGCPQTVAAKNCA